MIRAALVWLCLTVSAAGAVQPGEQLADPGLEARARSISAELRCLVCQNQSIDDSDAPLARDLRLLVRERLQAGDTDAGIREFLVARYGEYVLLKPPFAASTVFLWLAPLLVLILGIAIAVRARRARPEQTPRGLMPEEEEAFARILAEDARPSDAGGRAAR